MGKAINSRATKALFTVLMTFFWAFGRPVCGEFRAMYFSKKEVNLSDVVIFHLKHAQLTAFGSLIGK